MSSPGAFNLQDFKAEVLGKYGLARTNNFEVLIFPPINLSMRHGRMVSIMAEQSVFPSASVLSKNFKTFGPNHQRPVSIEYGGQGVNYTFHLDGRMHIKSFFNDWIHLAVNDDDYTVNYQGDYTSRIVVRQLNENNKVTHEIDIFEAYPTHVGQVNLDNNSQSQTSRLNVMFAYRYWKERKDKRLTDVPQYISQPQVPRGFISQP